MFIYKVAEPNEALIISGFRAHSSVGVESEGMGFKIVVGKGAFTIPGLQVVRRLSLDIHESELALDCVTSQGIALGVKAIVIYKIADDLSSIANAARRFLQREEEMDANVHNVFAGHLRSIVGTLTVEDLIRNRDKLTQATRDSAAAEMQRLGLTIDSLQILEIIDATGYIENLAMPEAARVAKEARIAQASADREATEREQEAEALKVAAVSASQIQQAQAQADAQKAQAEAQQSGPLAAAKAQQDVVVEETRVAELEAQRTEQKLQTEVRKPADAEAYKTRTVAEAERDARISRAETHAKEVELQAAADAQRVKLEAEAAATRTEQLGNAEAAATRATGMAQAESVKARGLAEADAIKARAEALAKNQEAVIGQQIAEKLPEIVGEAAKAFGSIDQLVVLNGADGVSDMFTKVLGMGASAIPMLRGILDQTAVAGNAAGAAAATRANGAGATPPAGADD